MRPMPLAGPNLFPGFTPARIDRKPADTRLREDASHQHFVPSKRGDGSPSPANGSFLDVDKTKYGTRRFFKCAPGHTFPLYPVMPQPGNRNVVRNPSSLNVKKGLTDAINPVSTKLSRMVEKPQVGRASG